MKVLFLACLMVSSLSYTKDSGLTCKQAYEKARWKTQHKKPMHKTLTLWKARKEKEFGKGTKIKDVEAAIEYGFKSGMYCQDKRILSQKEFRAMTIENMKAIQATKNNNGSDLAEVTVKEPVTMSCRELVQMSRTTKKDGLSRRTLLLATDLHNIEQAYSRSDEQTKESSKQVKRAKKIKDNFFRSVRNKAVRKHDDDSITIEDVHTVFNESIDDGTACSGKKVISRSKLRKHLVKKLADKENRSSHVNSNLSHLKNSNSPVNVIFKQNGKEQAVDIEGFQAQDA